MKTILDITYWEQLLFIYVVAPLVVALFAYIGKQLVTLLQKHISLANANRIEAGVNALGDMLLSMLGNVAAKQSMITINGKAGELLDQVSTSLQAAMTANGTTKEQLQARIAGNYLAKATPAIVPQIVNNTVST